MHPQSKGSPSRHRRSARPPAPLTIDREVDPAAVVEGVVLLVQHEHFALVPALVLGADLLNAQRGFVVQAGPACGESRAVGSAAPGPTRCPPAPHQPPRSIAERDTPARYAGAERLQQLWGRAAPHFPRFWGWLSLTARRCWLRAAHDTLARWESGVSCHGTAQETGLAAKPDFPGEQSGWRKPWRDWKQGKTQGRCSGRCSPGNGIWKRVCPTTPPHSGLVPSPDAPPKANGHRGRRHLGEQPHGLCSSNQPPLPGTRPRSIPSGPPAFPPGSQLLQGTAAAAAAANTTHHPGFLCLACSRPTQPSWLPSTAA